jgi:hypothetical protein
MYKSKIINKFRMNQLEKYIRRFKRELGEIQTRNLYFNTHLLYH